MVRLHGKRFARAAVAGRDDQVMLPFEPESVESMKARYPAAVADDAICRVIDGKVVGKRPGEQRRHVFDFADGLRLS